MEKIYYNGKILTMAYTNGQEELQQTPEAVLVRDGKIAGLGKVCRLLETAPDAVKCDLGGKCLMPSFIDAHSHFVMNGQMALCADLSGCSSYGDIIHTLKEYIEEQGLEEGQAVLGFGYDHNFLKEGGQPDKNVLDQVSTKIPILILHISAHLACANSAALALANITASTPNPAGGVIGRLPGGMEPNGYLEEAGLQILQKALMPFVKADPAKMMEQMQQVYLENGITTAQDGASSEKEIQMLIRMSDAHMLVMDVVAYPMMTAHGQEMMSKYGRLYGQYENHVKIGGYKLVLDGSPQGRSAWLTEPYLNGEEGYCGYPWMKDEEVERYIQCAVSEHRQILAHCNGDAASGQFINAYEKALKSTGIKEDLRPVMIHCQTVRDDQLDRMSGLNMIASVFVGHVWYWGDVHKRNLGEKRGNHISPVKDALDRNIHVNFHQDTPVTKPDMLHSVWCAVNRLSRSGGIIGADQRISVYEALRCVTIEAAYEYFEEDSKGSIEIGKRADLIILDRSPMETEPMRIREIKVLETIKDGETVFSASSF